MSLGFAQIAYYNTNKFEMSYESFRESGCEKTTDDVIWQCSIEVLISSNKYKHGSYVRTQDYYIYDTEKAQIRSAVDDVQNKLASLIQDVCDTVTTNCINIAKELTNVLIRYKPDVVPNPRRDKPRPMWCFLHRIKVLRSGNGVVIKHKKGPYPLFANRKRLKSKIFYRIFEQRNNPRNRTLYRTFWCWVNLKQDNFVQLKKLGCAFASEIRKHQVSLWVFFSTECVL